MSKYKLIIEYYQKGNNNSQIATLCTCSRTTVWTVLKRIKALGIEVYALNDMSEEEISSLLFPERAKAGEGYLIPDFKWEEFQMCKPNDKIRNKLKDFNFLLSCCPRGSINYQVIQRKKEEWLKSLKLEENKILDSDEE